MDSRSPAISLPPLNSHPVSSVHADASLQLITSHPPPCSSRALLFRLKLRLEYYDNPWLKGQSFPGLRFSRAYNIARSMSSAEIKALVCRILLDEKVVQFQLLGVTYTEGSGTEEYFLTSRNEFIERFTRFVLQAARDDTHREVMLDINKKVMMPKSEFRAWVSYIKQQTYRHKVMFGRAISRPRTEGELIDELNTYSNNNKSGSGPELVSMEEVKDMVLLDEEEECSCVVCLEQCCVGSKLKRMPCSHVFHQECIDQWLETSHVCPLCRYELAVVS